MKKPILLFLAISLGAFLGGTYIGKQVSDADHRQLGRMTHSEKRDKWNEDRMAFAQTLQPGDCYQYERFDKKEHTFEKTHVYKDHVHVVVERDEMGLLIAQPDPECKETPENSVKCDYWFRSVEFKDPFLVLPLDKKIPCPKGLTRKDMLKRLKADPEYSKQYEVSE